MPDLGKKGGKMPDLAFFGPKLYYKNAIKIDRAGIVVYYESAGFGFDRSGK
jgi:hypothetical protein